jgi:pimeloyl-ACP methyl ester carboxylesterase
MRDGTPPVRNTTAPRVDGKILLVHGFCADKNPFEVQASDWTDAVFYDGAKAGHAKSRSNNKFTEDVVSFIESQNLGTFSAVGQSQGGLVILHMLNYYHTGLDEITTGRKIQSIASPYVTCPYPFLSRALGLMSLVAARWFGNFHVPSHGVEAISHRTCHFHSLRYLGNTALTSLGDLAEILYPECAPPADMGRSGAEAWIAGISQTNIDQMNIYRTQYDKGGLFGNGWCNTIMNTLLENPNDGIVEVVYSAPLTATNVFPVKVGWCHKEDMNWPPSFWDKDRNAEMNLAAGRK